MLAAFQNVHGLRVYPVADGILVRACGGNDEVERLLSGRAGAFGHNIKELSVRLAQQLVKYAAVDVVAVLGSNLRGQGLIDGSGRRINEAFLRFHNLHCRCLPHEDQRCGQHPPA